MFRNFWPGIMGGAAPSFVVLFSGEPYVIVDPDPGFPSLSRAVVQIRASGDVDQERLNGGDGPIGVWVTGGGFDPTDYDFQWASGGVNPNWGGSNSINTWINGISLPLQWGHEGTGFGVADGSLEIRPAGGGSTIDTAPVSLTYQSLP